MDNIKGNEGKERQRSADRSTCTWKNNNIKMDMDEKDCKDWTVLIWAVINAVINLRAP